MFGHHCVGKQPVDSGTEIEHDLEIALELEQLRRRKPHERIARTDGGTRVPVFPRNQLGGDAGFGERACDSVLPRC